jgi:serine/threonine protein kinase/WD40 repeat protein
MLRKDDEPIPGYQLQRFLGRGQYGEVWKASAPGGASVALKFIALDARHGLKEFQAIQRVKEVRHAHLMPITALWLIDDFGNVMVDQAMDEFEAQPPSVRETLTTVGVEEIPGTPQMLVVAMLLGDNNLQDELNGHKRSGAEGIPVELLVQYMDEAARGIDFLNSTRHDLGEGPASIQHCDIKPANIILMGDSIVVCDFGLARTLGDATATATGMVGSPAYMAPECVGRKPSKASDQYSLAVSYYELRTGDLPFTNQTYAAVIDSHRDGNLDFSNVDEAEADVLKKATALKPENRFESATHFAAALRDVVSGSRNQSQQKNSTPLIVAAVAIFLAAMVGVYVMLTTGTATEAARIKVIPIDAHVKVDDKLVKRNADDWFVFSVPVDGTVEIEISSDPNYHPDKKTYDAKQLAQLEEPIRLEPNGAFYLARAETAFAANDEISAEAELVEAIRRGHDRWVSPSVLVDRDTPCMSLGTTTIGGNQVLWAGFTKGGLSRWQWEGNEDPKMASETDEVSVEFIRTSKNGWIGVGTLAALRIWDSKSDSASLLVELATGADLLSARFHKSNDLVAIGDADGGLQVYQISNAAAEMLKLEKSIQEQVVEVLITADNRVAAVGIDGAVSVWSIDDPAAEPIAFGLGHEPVLAVENDGHIVSAAANADSTTQLFPIRVHDLDSGKLVTTLRGHRDVILDAKLATQNLLVTGSESGAVGIWDLTDSDNYSLVDFPSSVSSVDATADGRWIVVGLNDGQIGLIDRENENYAVLVSAHEKSISDVVISADGWIFTADFDGRVQKLSMARLRVLNHARAKLKQPQSQEPAT